MIPSDVRHWVFPTPCHDARERKERKSASPEEIVRDEGTLNNPVKDIHMNIKEIEHWIESCFTECLSDEREILYKTTLDGIVKEKE